MNILDKHSAAGKMAGYLFQPERALYRLAESSTGSIIGIETLDDVAVIKRDGSVIQEQNKHSVSDNVPLTDHSVDLWKTLSIWSSAIKSEEINVEKAELFLVTNKKLPDCLARRIGNAVNESEIDNCIKELQEIGKNVPKTTYVYANEVLNHSSSDLAKLIKIIRLSDGNEVSHGKELRNLIASKLIIPTYVSEELVIDSLLGWLHSIILDLWREKKPAWITREAFTNQYFRIVNNISSKAFKERAKELIPVTEEERDAQKHRVFFQQLLLIAASDDELMEAIDDFICCKNEITRLSKEGNITKEDFVKFDNALKERWKVIFRRHCRKLKDKSIDNYNAISEETGYEIFSETMQHRELLAGIQTSEYYLTRGRYHYYSDNMVVGWHPDYNDILSGINKERKNE